jgi:hypothetical protein
VALAYWVPSEAVRSTVQLLTNLTASRRGRVDLGRSAHPAEPLVPEFKPIPACAGSSSVDDARDVLLCWEALTARGR